MDRGFERPRPHEDAEQRGITLSCRLSLDGELAIQALTDQLRTDDPNIALEYALGAWTSLVHRADEYDKIGFCGPRGFQQLQPVPSQPRAANSRDSTVAETRELSVSARIYGEFEEAAILHGLSIDGAIEAALAVALITAEKIKRQEHIGYTIGNRFFELD